MIESDEKMENLNTTSFTLEAQTITLEHFITNAGSTDAIPPTLMEFITDQSSNDFCQIEARELDQTGTEFSFNKERVLVRRTIIDGALQKHVPQTLRQRLFNLLHHLSPVTPVNVVCEIMRRGYYGPNTARNVNRTVRNYQSCVKSGITLMHKRRLQLFPATRPLEIVAVDSIGPPPKMREINQHVTNVTDGYSKLTRAVPTERISTTTMACIFFDAWVIPYGIPSYVHINNGTQFVRKCFGTLCTNLSRNHTTTTAYNSQTSGQVESYNKTILARQCHHVATHHPD